jgi:hypothetical protein
MAIAVHAQGNRAIAARARGNRAIAARARRHRAIQLTVAVAAAALAWGPMPAASAADHSFQAETTAVAVHLTLTQQPATSIITASLVDDAVGYASGAFDTSGTSEAIAAPAFPGRLVVQGPQLLCSELFSCPTQPPPYPLIADASYPRRPHDRASGGGQALGDAGITVTPLTAAAAATTSDNRATTAAGSVTLLPGTPVQVDVGASSATSTIRRTSAGLLVHLASTVQNVTISDLIHVRSVVAVDDVLLRPGQPAVEHPQVTLGAVDVAGTAATIDNRGVHIAGNDTGGLSQQLASSGIDVRTLGVHRADTRTGSRSDATGLRIGFALPVSGVPYIPNPVPPLPPPFDQVPTLPGVDANGAYVGVITLGAVGAAAGYGTQPSFDLGGVGPVPAAGPPSSGRPSGSQGGGRILAGNRFVAHLGAQPAQPAAPTVAPPATPLLRGFVDGLSKHALELVYAVLGLGTIALFTGWRLSAAAGRRGNMSR